MNAIIVSALLGVIMMFVSWGTTSSKLQRSIGLFGMLVLIGANLAQLNNWWVIGFDTKGMLEFNQIGCDVAPRGFNRFFIR